MSHKHVSVLRVCVFMKDGVSVILVIQKIFKTTCRQLCIQAHTDKHTRALISFSTTNPSPYSHTHKPHTGQAIILTQHR